MQQNQNDDKDRKRISLLKNAASASKIAGYILLIVVAVIFVVGGVILKKDISFLGLGILLVMSFLSFCLEGVLLKKHLIYLSSYIDLEGLYENYLEDASYTADAGINKRDFTDRGIFQTASAIEIRGACGVFGKYKGRDFKGSDARIQHDLGTEGSVAKTLYIGYICILSLETYVYEPLLLIRSEETSRMNKDFKTNLLGAMKHSKPRNEKKTGAVSLDAELAERYVAFCTDDSFAKKILYKEGEFYQKLISSPAIDFIT